MPRPSGKNILMKTILVLSVATIVLSAVSLAKEPVRKTAASGCTIAQVMKAIHQKKANSHFEYASDFDGEQGPPTQKRHESNDQYLFWIDNNGQTCPAIVTYASGSCEGGTAVVKTGECQ